MRLPQLRRGRRRTIPVLALALASALAAPAARGQENAAPPPILRWKFVPGSPTRYTFEQTAKVTVRPGAPEPPATHTVRGAGSLSVEPSADAARAILTLDAQVVSWMKGGSAGGAGQEAGESARLEEAYAMTPGGVLQVVTAANDGNTRPILDLVLALPPGGLVPGGRWERKVSIPTTSLGPLEGFQRIVFERVEGQSDRGTAVLSSKFELHARGVNGKPTQGTAVLKGSTNARFDLAAGRFAECATAYEMKMNLTIANATEDGKTLRMGMEQTGEISLETQP